MTRHLMPPPMIGWRGAWGAAQGDPMKPLDEGGRARGQLPDRVVSGYPDRPLHPAIGPMATVAMDGMNPPTGEFEVQSCVSS